MNNEPRPGVNISVSSETDVLKTVMMRLVASPEVLASLKAFLEPSIVRQFLHNRFVPYNTARAQTQQLELKNLLEAHGVRVILEAPIGGSGAHYTRDIGFAIDDTFFVARMGTRIRHQETVALEPWLARFSKVERLDAGTIEGGDVMLAPGRVLVGLGEATNKAGIAAFRSALARVGNTREVVPLEFTSPGVIHLDTKFNLVTPEMAIISRDSFKAASLKWLEDHFELVDATAEETRAIQINTLAIGNGKVIMDRRAERLANLIRARGVDPTLLDYSEITALPGSFRCTTLPLERSSE
ncbi:dimethylarginine dimethylaminohydrolase family protein [Nocardioides okcheonensis]|uniref:dimethylarginine dimethylaminohydrolase family protein n=1 Tax=Nocardioides okcheonensis TaxID=2894081 RepID=UPI001E2D1D4A|nr:arginine deiminase family protein [Nocardioides okcheonensis]UFN45170.1 arginine deiminase family protein [Nocardioides okcheonensis]